MENVKSSLKYVFTNEIKVVEQPNGGKVVLHRMKCVKTFTNRFGQRVKRCIRCIC